MMGRVVHHSIVNDSNMHGAQEDTQTAHTVVALLKINRFGVSETTLDKASSVASARSASFICAGVIVGGDGGMGATSRTSSGGGRNDAAQLGRTECANA